MRRLGLALIAALALPASASAALKPTTVATGLHAPWDLAFLPDGSALITERDTGTVRLLDRRHRLRRAPVGRVAVRHDPGAENGLLGIALDPAFRRNGFVYLYRVVSFTESQLLRYRWRRGRLRGGHVVIAGIPAGRFHDGGRIRFGPDGFLYLTTGETARRPSWAQDPASLAGKVLRTNAFRRSGRVTPEVFTRGHRNVQGLDWQPGTHRLLATEFGPDDHDEVNVLERGRDYGWPKARGTDTGGGAFTPAFVDYPQVIAPSGATFVHQRGSAWSGDFVFANLVGEQLRRLSFAPDGRVVRNEALLRGRFGRLRTVVEGPDGALYVLTSNTDGRGAPRRGDDRVLRLRPPVRPRGSGGSRG